MIPVDKKLDEIITVDKMSDTETIDDFFQDITKIMESKGKDVDKNVKNYTLFDDADVEDQIKSSKFFV